MGRPERSSFLSSGSGACSQYTLLLQRGQSMQIPVCRDYQVSLIESPKLPPSGGALDRFLVLPALGFHGSDVCLSGA